MKKHSSFKTLKKIIKISLISLLIMVLIAGASAFLIFHSYINKMNLTGARKTEDKASVVDSLSSQVKEGLTINTDKEITEYASNNSGGNSTNNDLAQSDIRTSTDASVDSISKEAKDKLNTQIDKNVNNGSEILNDDKILNILLIGSDTRNSKETGKSDSMILLTVNQEKKTITTTSFLRDIYLYIPGHEKNKLNASYSYGGAELLMDTLEQNFKIEIDRYVMVDFFSFIDIVNTIGGIKLDVSKEEFGTINNYISEINEIVGDKSNSDYLKKSGSVQLNGKQALAYSRIRDLGNGDFDRTSRQRKVLNAVYEKLKKKNVFEWNNVLNALLPEVTTNFTEGELLLQLLSMPSYLDYHLNDYRIPVEGTYSNINIGDMTVLGIDFSKNIEELQKTLYIQK